MVRPSECVAVLLLAALLIAVVHTFMYVPHLYLAACRVMFLALDFGAHRLPYQA